MNQRQHESTSTQRVTRPRAGFSIVEVLTSIVVAMIGVFGVMILIPFAVKQTQTGLDSDAAVTLGRNAYSQIEIWGYKAPTNWVVERTLDGNANIETAFSPFAARDLDGDGAADMPLETDLPQILSIDPLGIGENAGANVSARYSNAVFPFSQVDAGAAPYPPNLFIRSANLRTPTNTVMDLANARRLMRTTDDLNFGEALDDLLGPEQTYDFDPSVGVPLRRQFRGRLSWSAIVVPFKRYGVSDWMTVPTQRRWSYKIYILVYKDRQIFLSTPPQAEEVMTTSVVTNLGIQSPVSTVSLANDVTSVAGINRDDWVMLINRDDNAEPGFERQLAFYRVISAADKDPPLPGPGIPASLTLDGPDFTFSTDPATSPQDFGPTFVVHLNNVVGVYERTFEPEFESNWTVN